MDRRMIGNLTGIRGIAALWVLGYHFQEYFIGLFPGLEPWLKIFSHGHFGVDLFFSLSGYILGYSYVDVFSSSSLKFRLFWNYLVARFARIYPLYLLTTLGCFVIFRIGISTGHKFQHESPKLISGSNTVANILGIQTWLNLPSLNGPAWSVSAELFAYLLLPFLLFINYRLRSFVLIYNSVLFFLGYVIYVYSLQHELLIPKRILQVVTEFTMGLSMFFICNKYKRISKISKKLRIVVLILLLLLLLLVDNIFVLNLFVPFLVVALVALNAFQNKINVGLSRRSFLILGKLSYALYLSHRLLQHVMSGIGLPNYHTSFVIRAAELIGLIAIPIIIAAILTILVERPCRTFLVQELRIGNVESTGTH